MFIYSINFRLLFLINLFCCCLSFSLHAVVASIKAIGMGGTGVAFPQDALANAYNPAGISAIGDRLDIGLLYIGGKGKGTILQNRLPTANGSFSALHHTQLTVPEFGITKCLPYDLSIGLAVYNQNYVKTHYEHPLRILGTSKAGLEYIHEIIGSTVAWQFHPQHAFGISANVHIQRFKVNGLQNMDTPLTALFPGHLTNRGYEYSSGIGLGIGWIGQITPTLTLGATFQPRTHMRRFEKYKSFFPDAGRLNSPRVYSLGLAWRPAPPLALTFDIEHIQWRDIRAIRNGTAANPFVDRLGSKNGSGFDLRNFTRYHFGIEYCVNTHLTLRSGFAHNRAFVKSSSINPNLLTVEAIEDYLTLGASYRFACHEISVFYVHGFRNFIEGEQHLSPAVGGGFTNIEQERDVAGISWGYEF